MRVGGCRDLRNDAALWGSADGLDFTSGYWLRLSTGVNRNDTMLDKVCQSTTLEGRVLRLYLFHFEIV